MSWLNAALYEFGMKGPEEACLRAWRAALLQELDGDVLEMGLAVIAGVDPNNLHAPKVSLACTRHPARSSIDDMARSFETGTDDLTCEIGDDGVAVTVDPNNGELLSKKRLGGNFSASPTLAGNTIYVPSGSGIRLEA